MLHHQILLVARKAVRVAGLHDMHSAKQDSILQAQRMCAPASSRHRQDEQIANSPVCERVTTCNKHREHFSCTQLLVFENKSELIFQENQLQTSERGTKQNSLGSQERREIVVDRQAP